MSNTFSPGWREVDNVPMSDLRPGDYIADEQLVPEGAMRIFTVWRREVPVPPLPTEPGWYVDRMEDAWLLRDDQWLWRGSKMSPMAAEAYAPFQRMEPRAVAAKAVLDAMRAEFPTLDSDASDRLVVDQIASEFGVTS